MSRILVWLMLFALAALGSTFLLGPRGTLLAVVCCGVSFLAGRHLTLTADRAERTERHLQKSVTRSQSGRTASATQHAAEARRLAQSTRDDLEIQVRA